MGGSPPSTTTQISKVELPPWVDKASQENYAFAQKIADKPYEAYGGQTVADTSQTTQDAYQMFKDTLGTGTAQTTQANDLFSKAGQGILGMDRNAYMNPYIDNVETKALDALGKTRDQGLMANSDSAIAAKAFGGSRHGVVDAVTQAETNEKAGLLSANLRKDAYDNASGLMQGDINNMMTGGQGLLAGGQALADSRGKDFSGLLGIGQQEQSQTQAGLDSEKAKWQDAQDYDVNRLNILLSSLGMSPYGKTETTNKTSQSGGGIDPAQAGLGALSLLMGMFSDRNAKTDIKKLGKDELTGLDLYAYRYKGDPKSYPKVVGPMAQDIEKKFPKMVRKVGGHRMITGNAGVLADG